VQDGLAEEILSGQVTDGTAVEVYADENGISLVPNATVLASDAS
jgi:hypothetical protein